jgi:hypothetical protein
MRTNKALTAIVTVALTGGTAAAMSATAAGAATVGATPAASFSVGISHAIGSWGGYTYYHVTETDTGGAAKIPAKMPVAYTPRWFQLNPYAVAVNAGGEHALTLQHGQTAVAVLGVKNPVAVPAKPKCTPWTDSVRRSSQRPAKSSINSIQVYCWPTPSAAATTTGTESVTFHTLYVKDSAGNVHAVGVHDGYVVATATTSTPNMTIGGWSLAR